MAQRIQKGTKFKFKNIYHLLHEILSIDADKGKVLVKTTDLKEETSGETKWRLDDINHFVGTGEYVIENERPETNKHDQLENCGSHSE